MKIKRKKEKYNPGVKERIENFLYSDSIPANTTKFLLMFLAIGGLAFGGAVVPGVLKALENIDLGEDKTGYTKKKISDALANLKRQKMIEIFRYDNQKVSVKLTNKGQERIREFSVDTITIFKPKKWDGKWRILIFDIPTRPKIYNQARNALRQKIKELGFHQLQKSVWVFPYECEDEILFIAEIFEVEKYVEIVTAEKLLHEKNLRSIFEV